MKDSLRQKIEAEARRLGFGLFGVTTPDPPAHFDVFERWLEAGRHGEMGYLATERSRQRRSDPRWILPECRSILVLGMHYATSPYTGEPELPEADTVSSHRNLTGSVASYAWGDDYHTVIAARLRLLVAHLEASLGQAMPHRCYTDTGPILERELAQRAGLGWIGKNTCLINPQQGSYFFLAEVLLALELEPDQPFTADRCGNCSRCLDACPTGCILPDRTIDSRRCISYLTIELRGAIPPHLRAQIGDWIFGCDVCQQVCPWNQRFGSLPVEVAFAPRPGVPRPLLVEELGLSAPQFSAKFRNSPIKRTKRSGYLRNVAVALGNSHDPRAIPALVEVLTADEQPLVRGHAAWALGRIGGELACRALEQAEQRETEGWVVEEIRAARRQIRPKSG